MTLHRFVMVMFCIVMLAEHLTAWLGLPRIVRFLPEILTFATVLIVFVLGVQSRFRFVAGQYWFAFGLMLFIVAGSMFANDVDVGPTIAGMRYYLRAIPFFFLPAVCNFSDDQVKQQFKLLLLLAFVQVPIAVYQRWVVMSEGRFTGDDIFGTLMVSNTLSIFLVSAALVVVGLVLSNRLAKMRGVLIALVLLIPTMLNETKGTVVLLPVGLFVVLLVGAQPGRRLMVAAWTAALLVGFGAIFVAVYDYTNTRPWAIPLTEMFTNSEEFNRYMEGYLDDEELGVGATQQVGRKDSITIPLQYLASDPTRLVFGLGMGSASESQLGESFTGEYFRLFRNIAISSGVVFLLEIGLLGTAAVYFLYWLIFADSLSLARRDRDLRGSLAIGWAGVVAVFALSTFYTTTHAFASLAYLFWYFSGIVAARRMQIAARASTATAVDRPAMALGPPQPAIAQLRSRR